MIDENQTTLCVTAPNSGSLADALNINFDFAPDFLAAPLDHSLVLKFLHCELSGSEREQVIDYIAAYRPWWLAVEHTLRELVESSGFTSSEQEE